MPALTKYPRETRERATRFALSVIDSGPKRLSASAANEPAGDELAVIPGCRL